MLIYLHKEFAHNWIFLRLAAQEFYFKQPFDIKEEYTIMKSIMTLALLPFCLVVVFLYARTVNAIPHSTVLFIFPLLLFICWLTASHFINYLRKQDYIRTVVEEYNNTQQTERRKLYSFKNIAYVLFCTTCFSWCISIIIITMAAKFIPKS